MNMAADHSEDFFILSIKIPALLHDYLEDYDSDIDKLRNSKFPIEDENFQIILIDDIFSILNKVFIYNENNRYK